MKSSKYFNGGFRGDGGRGGGGGGGERVKNESAPAFMYVFVCYLIICFRLFRMWWLCCGICFTSNQLSPLLFAFTFLLPLFVHGVHYCKTVYLAK